MYNLIKMGRDIKVHKFAQQPIVTSECQLLLVTGGPKIGG